MSQMPDPQAFEATRRASLGVATRSAASGGLEKACVEAEAQMMRVKALKARRG